MASVATPPIFLLAPNVSFDSEDQADRYGERFSIQRYEPNLGISRLSVHPKTHTKDR